MKKIPYDLILKTVGATYGPKGRTVMMDRAAGLISTKDGQTIFFELWPTDREEKIFLNLIQEGVERINKSIGDGTTTAALVIAFLGKELQKLEYENPQEIAYDLEMFSKGLDSLLEPLKIGLESEDQLYQYCLSVSNRDEDIADKVSKALLESGSKGLVSIEEGKSRKIESSLRRGYRIDKGYEKTGERVFEECLVACIDSTLEKSEQVVPLLEEASQFPYPLLILSRGIYGEALKTLTMNHGKNGLQIGAARVPGRVDQQRSVLEDLAAFSGSSIWTPEYFPFESSMLGSFEKAIVKKDHSLFYSYSDKEEGIFKRIRELERYQTTSTFDQDELNRRIAMLSNGFVVLEVGGVTLSEIRERRGRVEDVLSVTKIALEEGVVPGGAMSFLWLSNLLKDSDRIAFRSLSKAFRNVWKFLVKEKYFIEDSLNLENPWEGYDVVLEKVRDFRVDPLLADSYQGLKEILEVSCSICSQILLVDKVILKP